MGEQLRINTLRFKWEIEINVALFFAMSGARSGELRCQKIYLSLFLHQTVFRFSAGPGSESGYFGPWQICKYLLYGRERCGPTVTRFKPIGE